MPAYNAAETVERTYREIPKDIVDEVILVDDCSQDATVEVAKKLGLTTIVHAENRGYGANQKTCYRAALEHGAQIIVMVHPDYQYDPHLILPLCSLLTDGQDDIALGSRILGGDALRGGMPLWKYVSNRFLTFIQNLLLGSKLSEFHTGYRAFRREVLQSLPLDKNSNDFVFDNEILAQIILKNYRVGEISCPAKYFPEASSINLKRSIIYGFGVLKVSLFGLLYRLGLFCPPIFQFSGPQTDTKKF
jgi:glycosyltransferase involved in cell wall biosynthesis